MVSGREAHAGRPYRYARVLRVRVRVHTFIGAWNSACLWSGRFRQPAEQSIAHGFSLDRVRAFATEAIAVAPRLGTCLPPCVWLVDSGHRACTASGVQGSGGLNEAAAAEAKMH